MLTNLSILLFLGFLLWIVWYFVWPRFRKYPVVADDGLAWDFKMPDRVLAIGDIHADPDAFTQILLKHGIVNKDGCWTFGKCHLVLLGDYFGSGHDSRSVLDICIDLERQALRSGGVVHALIGNRDLAALTGKLCGDGEHYLDFAPPEGKFGKRKIRRMAFHAALTIPGSPYAKWLRTRNTMIRIGSTLFVHGGIDKWLLNATPGEINSTVRGIVAIVQDYWAECFEAAPVIRRLWLVSKKSYQSKIRHWVVGVWGPLSTRVLAHRILSVKWFNRIVLRWKLLHIVIGHTPTRNAKIRPLKKYDKKVIIIDTGLSSGKKGEPSCLELDQEGNLKMIERISRPKKHLVSRPDRKDAGFSRKACPLEQLLRKH